MKEKPGVMIYFEIASVLKLLSDEDAGKLFRAILEYGQTRTMPQLPESLQIVWPLIQLRLDNDHKHYHDVCSEKGYAAYVRWQKERQQEYLSREDWLREKKDAALKAYLDYSDCDAYA